MRAGGGKAKGAEFERTVCKQLSLWVTKGKREDVFWRSAMSGGRATVGRKKGKDHSAQAGDISAVHPAGARLVELFEIECKFYGNLNVDSFIYGNGGKLQEFWTKLCKSKKLPLLIAKENRRPALVLMNQEGFARLSSFYLAISVLAKVHKPGAYIFTLENFLKFADHPQYRSLALRLRHR